MKYHFTKNVKNELKKERRSDQDSNLWPPDYKTDVLPQSYVELLKEWSTFLQYVPKKGVKNSRTSKKMLDTAIHLDYLG